MFETILSLAIGVGATIAVLAIAFVVGMRRKSRLLFAPLIGLQRTVMNPIQLRRAGQPGAYAGIIRHHGRRTGNAYETPVGILADGGGFLVALPYGPGTQWLRNVLAAGGAELVTEGRTVSVIGRRSSPRAPWPTASPRPTGGCSDGSRRPTACGSAGRTRSRRRTTRRRSTPRQPDARHHPRALWPAQRPRLR